MKVTVIIPCYNAASFIREAVYSILNQTYTDLEIIICDDCSTDESFAEVSKITDERVKVLRNEKNIGYLRTINKLLTMATGAYVAFQDADDVSHPERIRLQTETIEKVKLDLVGTNYRLINAKGKFISGTINVECAPEEIHKMLITKNMFQKPSILFKKDILEIVGRYREEFLELKNISEDYDWLLRIDEAGFRMGNINYHEPLYLYRSVSSAMTKGFSEPEQLFGARIAQYLAKERRSGNYDSIAKKDIGALQELIEKWMESYRHDPSRFFIERAEHLMYFGLKKQAIKSAWLAVLKSHSSLKSLRTLQYCIRKTYFGI